ncbi:MAG: sulfotransferase [Chloroflexi bacterium]|nr:sulfotransferase [Chloroflexota bacterium]
MAIWPNFFIVGAGRSGTTSLYFYLRRHPDIFLPWLKEPHFFSRGLGPWSQGAVTREEDYLKLFKDVGVKRAIGEASPAYLYDAGAPARIKEAVPQAKIIILLRAPIDRAYSQYLQHVRAGIERRPFYQAVVEDYESPRDDLLDTPPYVKMGLYYQQVKRYLDTFGRSQVRIYCYEDIEHAAQKLVEDTCAFLGVPFYDGSFFDATRIWGEYFVLPRFTSLRRVLSAVLALRVPGDVSVRYLLYRVMSREFEANLIRLLFEREAPKPEMDQEARAFLRSVYHEDIMKLQDLIGRDLDAWLV